MSISTAVLRVVTATTLLLSALPAHAAEPTVGECIAANESAISLRRDSKLQAALQKLLVCASPSCPVDIREECSERIESVNAALATVVFEAKDGAGGDVIAVTVTMDGQPLTERLDGTAITMDPGTHRFRFEAKGAPPVEKTLAIRQGEKNRHERISFGSERSNAAAPVTASTTESRTSGASGAESSASSPQSDHTPGDEPGSSSLPVIGLVTGAVGVIALGVGGALLIPAESAYEASNQDGRCTAPVSPATMADCNQEGLGLRRDALTFADTATVLFVGGGVLAATGLTLFLVGQLGDSEAASVRVAPVLTGEGAGVFAFGRF